MRQLNKILKYRLFIILFENFEFHNLLGSSRWKVKREYEMQVLVIIGIKVMLS